MCANIMDTASSPNNALPAPDPVRSTHDSSPTRVVKCVPYCLVELVQDQVAVCGVNGRPPTRRFPATIITISLIVLAAACAL